MKLAMFWGKKRRLKKLIYLVPRLREGEIFWAKKLKKKDLPQRKEREIGGPQRKARANFIRGLRGLLGLKDKQNQNY